MWAKPLCKFVLMKKMFFIALALWMMAIEARGQYGYGDSATYRIFTVVNKFATGDSLQDFQLLQLETEASGKRVIKYRYHNTTILQLDSLKYEDSVKFCHQIIDTNILVIDIYTKKPNRDAAKWYFHYEHKEHNFVFDERKPYYCCFPD